MLYRFKNSASDDNNAAIKNIDVQFENRVELSSFPSQFLIEGFVRYTPSYPGYGDKGYAEIVVYSESVVNDQTQRKYEHCERDDNFDDYDTGPPPTASWTEWEKSVHISYDKEDAKTYYAALRVVGNPIHGNDLDVYVDEMELKVLPYVLGSEPSVQRNRYVEVTIDPTDYATAPTPQKFWVLKDNANVDLSPYVATPVGKTEADGTKYEFTGWSASLTQQFTADTLITAQYTVTQAQDFYFSGTDANRPAEVPATYLQVTFDPTDKATDETNIKRYYWVNPNVSVDLQADITSNDTVPDPVGKTEADGTQYVFKGWSQSLTQQFTGETTITAQYDTVPPTQPSADEPEETTEPEAPDEPDEPTAADDTPWTDTEMVAAQTEGVSSITLSEVYVDGELLTERETAELGGILLVVEPTPEPRIPGRIVNRRHIAGRDNFFYDIYLIYKRTGERLENVSATVTIEEGYESFDDVRAFVLNELPNSPDYELQEIGVTVNGNKATFFGPHFSYYVLSFAQGGAKLGGPPQVIFVRPPETVTKEVVAPAPTEAKVDAAKAPVLVTPIPATGDSTGGIFALAALLLSAAAVLLLVKHRR